MTPSVQTSSETFTRLSEPVTTSYECANVDMSTYIRVLGIYSDSQSSSLAPSPQQSHNLSNPVSVVSLRRLSRHGSTFQQLRKKGYQDAAYGRSLNMLPVSNKETAGSYKVVTTAIGRG
ncbi:hypothetical protein Tco_0200557 [Tanacetum coccineum]